MGRPYVCQADIVEMAQELEDARLFGEEENEVARFCLACIVVGAKPRVVRQLANPCANFKRYWTNLEQNGYFRQDKHIEIEGYDTDIPFLLMMFCAQGRLERKFQPES